VKQPFYKPRIRADGLAVVIGNGPSRANVDLMQFVRNEYPTYGCNALYREYSPRYDVPHILVAIDDGMIAEIESSGFPQDRLWVPPVDERWEPAIVNPSRPRANAGVIAIKRALEDGHRSILCLGFDFLVRDDRAVLNVYDGTMNYGPTTRATINDSRRRIRFLEWVALSYKSDGARIFTAFPNSYAAYGSTKSEFHAVGVDNVMRIWYNDLELEGVEL